MNYNRMNKYIITFALIALTQTAFPQAKQSDIYTVKLAKPGKPGTLTISNADGSTKITGYSGNDIQIKSSLKNMKKFKEYVSISSEDTANEVAIAAESDESTINLDINVPYAFSINISSESGEIEVRNINGTLALNSEEGNIKLFNMSGSGFVTSVDGSISAEFNKIDKGESLVLNTIDGKIELILPGQINANINAQTESGEIFTDFTVSSGRKSTGYNSDKKEGVKKVSSEYGLIGKINNGGENITLNSVDGNIYLKKK